MWPLPVRRALGADQDQSAARLRRMKRNATALLVLAAVIYVITVTVHAWHGELRDFVQAGAEAAMVGGLADWFAVTALFRRPLGLPIPHSALIPRKKDELATKLGEFVTGYFLTPEALQAQVAESGLVTRIGSWLADPDHAGRLAGDLAAAAGSALGSLDSDEAVDYVLELLRRDQTRRSYAPLLGRLLERAIQGGAQRPLVDILAERARVYLAANKEALHPTVKRFIEERHWVAWVLTTDRLVTKLIDDTITELGDVEHKPDHPLRIGLEGLLTSVAADLQTNRVTIFKVDRLAARLVEDPGARAVVRDLVGGAIDSVQASLRDPAGDLSKRIAALIASVGQRAVDDTHFHDQIEHWLEGMISHAVSRYGQALTQLIRRQVGEWPAQDASRRIELAVGRDLQFIRINGTAVGALAGLAIHAVTLLL